MIEGNTALDSMEFRLSPSYTRCELYIVAQGVSEKIASGFLKPFLEHSEALEERISQVASPSLILERPPISRKHRNRTWFTKSTLERFVRFVSTPEVLERVMSLDEELKQLERIRKYQEKRLAKINDQYMGNDTTVPSSGVRNTKEAAFMSRQSSNTIDSKTEASKRELLRAMNGRLVAIQKEQNESFSQAFAAGFNTDNMVDLIAFAEYFRATRLREACTQFLELYKKRKGNEMDCTNSHSTMSTDLNLRNSNKWMASNVGSDSDQCYELNYCETSPDNTQGSFNSMDTEMAGFGGRDSEGAMKWNESGPEVLHMAKHEVHVNSSSEKRVSLLDKGRDQMEATENEQETAKEIFNHQYHPSEFNLKDGKFLSNLKRMAKQVEIRKPEHSIVSMFDETPNIPLQDTPSSYNPSSLGIPHQKLMAKGVKMEASLSETEAISIPCAASSKVESESLISCQGSMPLSGKEDFVSSSSTSSSSNSGASALRRFSVKAAISLFESKQSNMSEAPTMENMARRPKRWSGAHEPTSNGNNLCNEEGSGITEANSSEVKISRSGTQALWKDSSCHSHRTEVSEAVLYPKTLTGKTSEIQETRGGTDFIEKEKNRIGSKGQIKVRERADIDTDMNDLTERQFTGTGTGSDEKMKINSSEGRNTKKDHMDLNLDANLTPDGYLVSMQSVDWKKQFKMKLEKTLCRDQRQIMDKKEEPNSKTVEKRQNNDKEELTLNRQRPAFLKEIPTPPIPPPEPFNPRLLTNEREEPNKKTALNQSEEELNFHRKGFVVLRGTSTPPEPPPKPLTLLRNLKPVRDIKDPPNEKTVEQTQHPIDEELYFNRERRPLINQGIPTPPNGSNKQELLEEENSDVVTKDDILDVKCPKKKNVVPNNTMNLLVDVIEPLKLGGEDELLYCSGDHGRLYELYRKLRDEKLRMELPAKRAQRDTKLRAMAESLVKKKAEMKACNTRFLRRTRALLPIESFDPRKQEQDDDRVEDRRQEGADALFRGPTKLTCGDHFSNERNKARKTRFSRERSPMSQKTSQSVYYSTVQATELPVRNQNGFCGKGNIGSLNQSNAVENNPQTRPVTYVVDLRNNGAGVSYGERQVGSAPVYSRSYIGRSKNFSEATPIETEIKNIGPPLLSSKYDQTLKSSKSWQPVLEREPKTSADGSSLWIASSFLDYSNLSSNMLDNLESSHVDSGSEVVETQLRKKWGTPAVISKQPLRDHANGQKMHFKLGSRSRESEMVASTISDGDDADNDDGDYYENDDNEEETKSMARMQGQGRALPSRHIPIPATHTDIKVQKYNLSGVTAFNAPRPFPSAY